VQASKHRALSFEDQGEGTNTTCNHKQKVENYTEVLNDVFDFQHPAGTLMAFGNLMNLQSCWSKFCHLKRKKPERATELRASTAKKAHQGDLVCARLTTFNLLTAILGRNKQVGIEQAQPENQNSGSDTNEEFGGNSDSETEEEEIVDEEPEEELEEGESLFEKPKRQNQKNEPKKRYHTRNSAKFS
jgi:hypothetical protein